MHNSEWNKKNRLAKANKIFAVCQMNIFTWQKIISLLGATPIIGVL